MLKIDRIVVNEFRGLRHVQIDLNGTNHVVVGPNGSGKSGIVDAIDFAFTGKIRRLSGEGAGELNLGKHGPHVSATKTASVSLTLRDATSGKTAILTRAFPKTSTYTLVPEVSAIRSAITRLAGHQEITLSRREILRFVTSTPSTRAQEVSTLLNLSKLRDIGKNLSSNANTLSKEAGLASDAVTREWSNAHAALGLVNPTQAQFLGKANEHRKTVGLAPIIGIDSAAQVASTAGSATLQQVFNKAAAVAQVDRLTAILEAEDPLVAEALVAAADPYRQDQDLLSRAELSDFYSSGFSKIVDEYCPLCDFEWESIEELQAHVQAKVTAAKAAVNSRAELSGALNAADRALRNVLSAVDPLIAASKMLTLTETTAALEQWAATLAERSKSLQDLPSALAIEDDDLRDISQHTEEAATAIKQLTLAVDNQPDQDPTETAKAALIGLQLSVSRIGQLEQVAEEAAISSNAASRLAESYTKIQEDALTKLYEDVETDFSDYYRFLNSDDESDFSAKFTQSSASLKLEVDFFNQGTYPPGALHSEGHQDSMGVCLYLALMRRVLANDLSLLVLDDVVMSVDTGHRRKLAELLSTAFKDVQFVMTTHDRAWADQMRTVGLIANNASYTRFWGWKVDTGPITSDGPDFWSLIESEIAADEVANAGARLRRNLEATLSDLTVRLQGSVKYRPDGNYDFGHFRDAVRERHGRHLKKALNAAKSHGQQAKIDDIEGRLLIFRQADAAKEAEHSVVNPVVHHNEWANFTADEFRPVVAAWKAYLETLQCKDCKTYVRIEATGGDGILKCKCGNWMLNLTSK